MRAALLARVAAIAIAVAAVIDPAISRERTVPVRVRVIHQTAPAIVDTLQRSVGERFALREEEGHADAWLLVHNAGDPLPRVPAGVRVFTLPAARERDLYIDAIQVPDETLRGQKPVVTARIASAGLSGETISASLFAGGRLAARAQRTIDADRATTEIPLTFTADAAGSIPLHVEIDARGLRRRSAETSLHVSDRTLRVRFEDARPSWTSTFVRRALEASPLFDVSSSVATSRGLTSEMGVAPSAPEHLDALILGTPGVATPAQIERFERFVRERGGTGIVLADEDAAAALERLTRTGPWPRRRFETPATASTADGISLRFTDVLLSPPEPVSRAIATLQTGEIAAQEVPAGRGRLIVFGPLDAWRYRAADASFATFWQSVVATGAASALPSIVLSLQSAARPGEEVAVEAVVRDRNVAAVDGVLRTSAGEKQLRFWPSASPGVFHATASTLDEGMAAVTVTATSSGAMEQTSRGILITPRAAHATASMAHVAALASASGGAHVESGDLEDLRDALTAAFPSHTTAVVVHPMRYAWWLAPFTLLLAVEWRWRRRHGLR